MQPEKEYAGWKNRLDWKVVKHFWSKKIGSVRITTDEGFFSSEIVLSSSTWPSHANYIGSAVSSEQAAIDEAKEYLTGKGKIMPPLYKIYPS